MFGLLFSFAVFRLLLADVGTSVDELRVGFGEDRRWRVVGSDQSD